MAAFERNPGWEDAVALRRWDDHAKVDGLEVPELRSHWSLLLELSARPSTA